MRPATRSRESNSGSDQAHALGAAGSAKHETIAFWPPAVL